MRALMVLLVMACPALADDAESPNTTHKGQFGLSARLGVGVRAIATYGANVFCGADVNDRVCIGRAPMAFDLEAAYGVADSIELTLELRIGAESDFGAT